MYKKLSSVLLGVLAFLAFTNFSFAQDIPSGYVLVPLSALSQNQSISNLAQISTSKSALRANEDMGFVGSETVITATIRDENGNPLPGKNVSLISSRASDSIRVVRASTDSNGEALFAVSGQEEGVSAFTAIAEGQTITERPKVVFIQDNNAIGGNLLRADLVDDLGGEDAGGYTLEIDAQTEESVSVDTPLDIVVKVKTLSGEVDETFLQSISFTSPDPNAILPRDYEFKEIDRGEHTFANAITFTTPGSKTVEVSSSSELVAPASVSIEVLGSASSGLAPIIREPYDGAAVGSDITVSGIANANSNLAVFVDSQLTEEGESDTNGSYAIDLNLEDGSHTIAVALVDSGNSVGATSDTITVNADSTPPAIINFTSEPSAPSSSDEIRLVLQSEANLQEARITVGGKNLNLVEESDGVYVGKVENLDMGEYTIEALLTDAAGNTKSYPEAFKLTVQSALTIKDVEASPKDGRVDFKWEPPSNHAEIRNYKIFYGTGKDQLEKFYETPDSGTSWYVGALNNDTVYYFQIISYDTEGKSNGSSEIIEATPSSILELSATGCDGKLILSWLPQENSDIVSYRVDYGIAPKEYVENRIVSGGKEAKEWEIRDLVNGVEYFATVRGVNELGDVVFDTGEETSATPTVGACHFSAASANIQLWQRKDESGNTVLVWSPVQGAVGYNVYAGTAPNTFNLPTVMVTTPYLRPEGLTPGKDYYFAVKAVFANGEAETLSNVTKVEVGPAEVLAISIGIALLGAYFFRRKRSLG